MIFSHSFEFFKAYVNTIGIICKPNDFTSQKTAWELGVFIKDKGVTLLEDGDDFEKDADLIVVVGGDGNNIEYC